MKSLILEELTTDQKLGLLLCGRPVTNPAYWDEVWEMIQNRMLGSIQIPRAAKRLEYAKKVLKTADYPILLIDDMKRNEDKQLCKNVPAYQALPLRTASHSRSTGKNDEDRGVHRLRKL